jgi:hypothetical protein
MNLSAGSRYGIMSMPTPGVAGQYAFNGEIAAFKQPMFFQGFHTILRAGGGIAAFISTQQRRYAPLIDPDQPYKRVT